MKKMNSLIVAGALTAVIGTGALVTLVQEDSPAAAASTAKALVATAAVPPGTPVAKAGLEVREMAGNLVPPGSATDVSALTGQVALRPLAAGEVVAPGAFGVQGVAAAGGVILPAGKEGIGVELAFAPGGLRYVVPGNKVTVWSTPKVPEGKPLAVQMLLQNVQVIATTPGAGTGAATEVVAGPGTLQFLLALNREESATLIAEQARGSAMYFTLSDSGLGTR